MRKETLEKVFEYASMPVHGTLSRKLRKGLRVQVNDGPLHEGATIFLGDEFVRITEDKSGEIVNTYYDWTSVSSVRTYATPDNK
ncbi:hypothetical protein [Paucidesulfovibrio longus]|uniref:hypothetical protein n=1 Tax=Paucidesulfovibrio longus TaxID=889 RepID=UPI0003B43A0F|nr:hypothetical protein [Paucidesulfovibrio longus]